MTVDRPSLIGPSKALVTIQYNVRPEKLAPHTATGGLSYATLDQPVEARFAEFGAALTAARTAAAAAGGAAHAIVAEGPHSFSVSGLTNGVRPVMIDGPAVDAQHERISGKSSLATLQAVVGATSMLDFTSAFGVTRTNADRVDLPLAAAVAADAPAAE